MPFEGMKKTAPRFFSSRLRLASVIFGIAVIAIVVIGIDTRVRSNVNLREWTEAQAVPTVAVAPPGVSALSPKLDLPGRLEAYSRAPIFARINGYIKNWKVDIGSRVKAGQILAEIEAPDMDQQLLQARAGLLSLRASAELAAATLKRRQALLANNVASQQDVDERTADLASKRANVQASQANVERLEALAGFKNIVAPFDGIVTARNTDVGALINAGAGAGNPLFVVSDIHKLRVYINVPQTYAPSIQVGAKASITVPERPNQSFPGDLEFSSRAVDAATGTIRMQMIVDNPNGELLPGGFANVSIDLSRAIQPLHIPASALIFDRNGLRVATVDGGDHVRFKKIKIARDLGKTIEIASGLDPEDRLIIAPPDGLSEGDKVRVVNKTKNDGVPTATLGASHTRN